MTKWVCLCLLGLPWLGVVSSPVGKHPSGEQLPEVKSDYWGAVKNTGLLFTPQVFQRREDGFQNFNLKWNDYADGFGLRPIDCAEVQTQGSTESGVYLIFVGPHRKPIRAYCDLQTEGGGWLVFQRREDGFQNFNLKWNDYADGFGDLLGEFWLGNHFLHMITQQKDYKLRVELSDFDDNTRYAEYSTMKVAAPFQKYRLQLGTYSGNAGDALEYHSQRAFSTRDRDNDDLRTGDCADKYKGGWWYNSCHNANPNGLYHGGEHTTYADGVNWRQWRGYNYSMKATELKLRPVDFRL